jgi:hypothetical protein
MESILNSNDEPQEEVKTQESESLSLIEGVWWLLVRAWGVVLRSVFIPAIGILLYNLIDPAAIGSKPIAQITLTEIRDNIFALFISLGCLYWFFQFPEHEVPGGRPKDSPYISWAEGGTSFIVCVIGALYLYAEYFE